MWHIPYSSVFQVRGVSVVCNRLANIRSDTGHAILPLYILSCYFEPPPLFDKSSVQSGEFIPPSNINPRTYFGRHTSHSGIILSLQFSGPRWASLSWTLSSLSPPVFPRDHSHAYCTQGAWLFMPCIKPTLGYHCRFVITNMLRDRRITSFNHILICDNIQRRPGNI